MSRIAPFEALQIAAKTMSGEKGDSPVLAQQGVDPINQSLPPDGGLVFTKYNLRSPFELASDLDGDRPAHVHRVAATRAASRVLGDTVRYLESVQLIGPGTSKRIDEKFDQVLQHLARIPQGFNESEARNTVEAFKASKDEFSSLIHGLPKEDFGMAHGEPKVTFWRNELIRIFHEFVDDTIAWVWNVGKLP